MENALGGKCPTLYKDPSHLSQVPECPGWNNLLLSVSTAHLIVLRPRPGTFPSHSPSPTQKPKQALKPRTKWFKSYSFTPSTLTHLHKTWQNPPTTEFPRLRIRITRMHGNSKFRIINSEIRSDGLQLGAGPHHEDLKPQPSLAADWDP